MKASALAVPLLLLGAYATGFFFHGAHDTTYAPAIFLALLASLICFMPSFRGDIVFPRGVCIWLTLVFWGYLSLSLLWTTVPFASLVTWLNLTVLPILLLGLLCAENRDDLIRNSVLALIAATSSAALYVLWQFFIDGVQRASGLLPNPNNMAALLNLSLLPLLAYTLAGDKRYRVISVTLSLLLFAALLATGSRGGLLCFLSGMAVIGIALFKPLKEDWKPAAGLMLALSAVFAGFYFLTHTALEESLPVLGDPAADYSSFERLAIWQGALAMLRDHWLTGTGLGTFYLYYPTYRLDGDAVSMGHWAHFDALQLGAETGFLALALFYAVAAAWFLRGTQSLLAVPAHDPRRTLIAGCLAALLALILHAHIEFQFYILVNLMMAAVLMAALYSLTAGDNSFMPVSLRKRDRFVWSGALLTTFSMVSLTLFSTAAGVHFLNRAQTAMDKGDLDDFISNIGLSRQYAPRSFADADVRLAGLYIDLVSSPGGMMTTKDRANAYKDALQLLAEAQASNPAWADIDHKRAKLYAHSQSAGEPDHAALAIESWTTALHKNPLHYRAREEFARFLIKKGRVDEAYALLQEGLRRPATKEARALFSGLNAQIQPLILAKRQFQTPQPAEKPPSPE